MNSSKPQNRLAHETSPYLRQHAHQPVDWYPWGSEALEKAVREDKPIFLSIGYSACHWCHVMSRECFDDEEIARIMNERFVSIKVDREERPEIDALYMKSLIAMNGQGGWPLNLFLTPKQAPYLGGTYFPPTARSGHPGFREVLSQAGDQYRGHKDQVVERSSRIVEKISRPETSAAARGLQARELIQEAVTLFQEKFDENYGGFGMGMKFPEPMLYTLLLRHWATSESNPIILMVDKSLTGMAEGGLYDQLGGGFHRYSTDRQWRVPHFEKMLIDNALLARLYLEAFQATQQEIYQRIPEEIFEYVAQEMTSPEGGFYTSQDADTGGREGVYFTWELKEVLDVLGPRPAKVLARAFGMTPNGHLEKRNVLHIAESMEKISEEEGMPIFEVNHILKTGRQTLLERRGKRTPPGRDEKILAGWNGMMIAALATGFKVLRESRWLERAVACADFIWDRFWQGNGLLRVYKDAPSSISGCLEDYAGTLEGWIALFEASMETRWLERARMVADAMIDRFWDDEGGGFFITSKEDNPLIARLKNPADEAAPSANAVAAMALLRLGRWTGHVPYEDKGRHTLQAFYGEMEKRPAAFTGLLSALDYMEASPVEIVLSGPVDHKDYKEMLETVYQDYRPNQQVVLYGEEIAQSVPWAEGRGPVAGKPTAYVCKDGTCHPPVHTAHALYNLLGRTPEIQLNIFDEEKKIKDMESREQTHFLNAMSQIFKHSGLGGK